MNLQLRIVSYGPVVNQKSVLSAVAPGWYPKIRRMLNKTSIASFFRRHEKRFVIVHVEIEFLSTNVCFEQWVFTRHTSSKSQLVAHCLTVSTSDNVLWCIMIGSDIRPSTIAFWSGGKCKWRKEREESEVFQKLHVGVMVLGVLDVIVVSAVAECCNRFRSVGPGHWVGAMLRF